MSELVSEKRLEELLDRSGWQTYHTKAAFREGARTFEKELGVVETLEVGLDPHPHGTVELSIPQATLLKGPVLIRARKGK